MELKISPIGLYFKTSVKHLTKIKIIFFIISTIEFIDVLVCLLDNEELLYYSGKNYYEYQTDLADLILKISPFEYFMDFQRKSDGIGFDRNYISIVIYLLLLLCFYFYLYYLSKINNFSKTNKSDHQIKNSIQFFLDKICINFFDYIVLRLAPIYGLDVLARGIFRISKKENFSLIDSIIQFILFACFIFSICTHFFYFVNVCIICNFKSINSDLNNYPNDNFFSIKYDLVLYIIKILIVIEKNYLAYNNYEINIIAVYLSIIFLFIFYAYCIYCFYIIFLTEKAFYINSNFYNKLRLFFLLSAFEALILRLGFFSQGDVVPYLTYFFILLLFNVYIIVLKIDYFLIANACRSQNYLAICWLIQSNNYNIQDFTIEWISYHKVGCIYGSIVCPICSQIKREDINFIPHHSQENETSTNTNTNNLKLNLGKNKNKNEIKKTIKIINKSTIDELFPPFIFLSSLLQLAQKSAKFMTKEEKMRYNFLELAVLFYYEKNVDFAIYDKICENMIKYQDITNAKVMLFIIYDLVKKTNTSANQKYEIVMKNEELKVALDKYLNDFEEFIFYSEKTPINFFDISIKCKTFRDLLKTLLIYFKKNIGFNYELIIMRYLYETIIHTKFKNTQSIDLSMYEEFLEYHYNNDKVFLLKYLIDQDNFTIIKGSKDTLKKKNYDFFQIFPSNFRQQTKKKFKSLINNLENKELKPLFEFIIRTNNSSNSQQKNYGFVDSFKMKYIIYPTNLINELYIEANYQKGYNNIIIFRKDSDGKKYLYSFSPHLIKYLGISPNDIFILYKCGVLILFSSLFKKASSSNYNNNNNNNKEGLGETPLDKNRKNYIFNYDNYLRILYDLLSYDALRDSLNYNYILEKKKEIEEKTQKKEIIFQLMKKNKCLDDNGIVHKIYTIKEIKKKSKNLGMTSCLRTRVSNQSKGLDDKINNNNGEFDDEDEDNEELEDEFDENDDEIEKKNMKIDLTMSMSSQSLSKSQSSNQSVKDKDKKNENQLKKKRQQQLNQQIFIILLCCIVLIIITILFLILENTQNNRFKRVINLFNVFLSFKRNAECMPLTLLSNYQFHINGKVMKLYQQYSKNLGKKIPYFSSVNLNEILIYEMSGKLDAIMQAYATYQKEIYNLGTGISNKMTGLEAKTYQIQIASGQIYLYSVEIGFIALSREYLNILSRLLDNNTYTKNEFPLMSFLEPEEDKLRIKVSYDGEVSIEMENMLLLLLVYPFLHVGLTKSSDALLEESRNVVKKINLILIVFFILLVVFHFALFIIGILFLLSFIKISKINMSNANEFLLDKKYLLFLHKRLSQIMIMKNLYAEDPFKLKEKIEIIDEHYYNKKDGGEVKYNKEFTKEETKDFNKNNHHSNNNNNNIQNTLKTTKTKISIDNYEKNHTSNKNLDIKQNFKDDFGKGEDKDRDNRESDFNFQNIDEKILMSNKKGKINNKQFYTILSKEYILLFFSFSFYYIFSIVLFILVYLGKRKLDHLVDYSTYNNNIDGYIFDITNSLLYLFETNCSSFYYGNITDPDRDNDYIEESIDLLSESILGKEDVEFNKEAIFQPVRDFINLNCSEGILEDSSYQEVMDFYKLDYQEFFKQLCKAFPSAATGSDSTIFHEFIYIMNQLYQRYEQDVTFENLFQDNLNQTMLFDLFTLILTFNRIRRTYFNDVILVGESEELLNYFSTLISIYLIIGVFYEIILFLVLYIGIINQIKSKDNLIMSFINSIQFDK